MKISELPKEIREKALKYQMEDRKYLGTDELLYAFCWEITEEGSNYWANWCSLELPKKELKDTIVEAVIEQLNRRSKIGINKYGVTLDRTDLSTLEWIQHAQEEAMDLCLYLEKIKQELKPVNWYDEKLEERINIIGQNGNDGEHYAKERAANLMKLKKK